MSKHNYFATCHLKENESESNTWVTSPSLPAGGLEITSRRSWDEPIVRTSKGIWWWTAYTRITLVKIWVYQKFSNHLQFLIAWSLSDWSNLLGHLGCTFISIKNLSEKGVSLLIKYNNIKPGCTEALQVAHVNHQFSKQHKNISNTFVHNAKYRDMQRCTSATVDDGMFSDADNWWLSGETIIFAELNDWVSLETFSSYTKWISNY